MSGGDELKSLDLSLFVERSNDGTARYDARGRGHRLRRRASRKIESASEQLAGRDRRTAQLYQPAPAVDWRDDAFDAAGIIEGARSASAIAPIRSRPSAPKPTRRAQARWLLRCLAVAGFAAMNVMLLSVSVWAGNATDIDAGDARPLPLALGADRAAGRRLCRPAVLPQRARGAARTRAQHGRADLARRHPGARHVGGRDRGARRARLFRFGAHAAVLPAARPLPRSCDAAQDAHRSRPISRACSRVRARCSSHDGELSRCRSRRCSRAIASWSAPAIASRRRHLVICGRSEIDDSLITGETRAARSAPVRRSMRAASIFPAR